MNGTPTPRFRRADARRNYERLLKEARAAFDEHGIDTSLEDVARRAGVGIGTLYRHFPARDSLLEAVLRDRFDALTEHGRALLREPEERPVLLDWSRSLAEMATTYRGLTGALMGTLRDEKSDLHASCEAMRRTGAALLRREQEAGRVRADVDTAEFLALLHGAAWAGEQAFDGASDRRDKLVALVLDGLAPARSGAAAG
ncbi:TetR family transcriptional regulator [Actinomadura rayongensis]|uniref:TetR family transcriptional regulator n=1 Tax=Actinomadura rayongensis TaxID=1429076 RepID=A0A6I4WID3_9ACTN|nr:TetR family transcriptional regulator [Actinomadura rayongensis]